jgi:hypothetical protein
VNTEVTMSENEIFIIDEVQEDTIFLQRIEDDE